MEKRIVFWINADITIFSMAKFLQQKINDDFFAVIDITNKPKKFFQKQNIVKFKKSWFYHDHVKNELKNKPDMEYLTKIEEKYNFKIWELISNDRFFNNYNNFYKFNSNEALLIFEEECKLYESILNDINPDFLIIHETALRNQHLFYLMCKKHGVKILMLNYANYQSKCFISQNSHKIDELDNVDEHKTTRTISQLQEQLDIKNVSSEHKKLYGNIQKSKISKILAAFQLLFKSNNSNIKTHYTYFGRTKIRVLIYQLKFELKKKFRHNFINHNLIYKINENEPFIYFPLHQEPERSLLIAAPYFTNQIETIKNIVKSMPVGLKLFVKEHPTQGPARGWRSISAYKEIMKIPNVVFLHPSVSSRELIKKSSLVISVGGTACFEAAFFEKQSITFANLGFETITSIHKIDSIQELQKTIKEVLDQKTSILELDNYLTSLEKNLFNFDLLGFEVKMHRWFYFEGNLVDVNISEDRMEDFLKENKEELTKLSSEFIKKMKHHKRFIDSV